MTILVKDIVQAVADHYGVDHRDMLSDRRSKRLSKARQVSAWIARRRTPYSLQQIARDMGGIDHSTVHYSVSRIDAERERDPELVHEIAEIVDALLIAQEAVAMLGIKRSTREASEIAGFVLENPERNAVAVCAADTLTLALAVRAYETRIAELERVERQVRELVAATRATASYDDRARAEARQRQRQCFAALARLIPPPPPTLADETNIQETADV